MSVKLVEAIYNCCAFMSQVRVCAFPASRLGLRGIGISPDCNPENRATPRQVIIKDVS